MGKFVDSICMGVAIFILTFVIAIEASHKTILSLILAIILSIIIVISSSKLIANRHEKSISSRDFDTYMIVKGITYQLEVLGSLYPQYIVVDKYIKSNNNIIVPIIKFSKLGKDDILKAYNTAQSENISTIYIISNNIDRETILFSNMLYDVEFHFIRSHELYKILRNNNSLPSIPKKPKRTHLPAKTLLSAIFNRSNTPRFLLTSIVLLFVGLVTPFKGYYHVFSAISAIFVLISMFNNNIGISNKKLPFIKNEDSSHK